MANCPTGKVPFTSESRARKRLRTLRATLRVYQCPLCRAWHLSKRRS